MKITFLLPGFGRSGGIKVTAQAANGLLQRGHDVTLLVNVGGRGVRGRIRNLWLRFRYPQGFDWIELFQGEVKTFTDIEQCAFEDNEIVVAAGWWAGMEMRRLKGHKITKIHYIHSQLKDTDLMLVWGESVPKIVVASFLADGIEKTCGQKPKAVIHNGINPKEYYPSVPESERNGVGTILGYGRLKSPETTLEVLQKLHQMCPKTPQRVFGACRRPKEIPRGWYNRLPSLEKTRDIYSRSLVWILASRSEGFGVPILEAMACNCAVVATDCGGTRDIIVDGENGFLVEVGDVEQIVDRVKRLLDDRELRQRFVRKSRETVSKFSLDRSINRLERILIDLARERTRQNTKEIDD
ncbi:MAG: glycosyltransferase family 4 protein [Planctomycetota bacterium]|jgi:glycosyltransferase involved in cell wall biosynthesis